MPTWRRPAQPHHGGVGLAPTVATENANARTPFPRRTAAPLELVSMGSAVELRMRGCIPQIGTTTGRFATPLWHPRHGFGDVNVTAWLGRIRRSATTHPQRPIAASAGHARDERCRVPRRR